jgi:hypothetical protein
MEQLKGGIFISPKDIVNIRCCSLRSAQRDHLRVRTALGISLKNLTVKAYCDYWKLSYDEVANYINQFR